MDRLRRRKYLVLLVTVLFLIVVYPMLRGILVTRLVYDALITAVFLVALATVLRSQHRVLALLLGVPTLVGLWTGYVLPGLPRLPLILTFHSLAVLFLGYIVTRILAEVYQQDRIEIDSVCGALCGYLLVGLAFGHLYCILERATPGSFHGSDEILEQLRDEGQVHFQLTYFSFLTLTTVGYGDIAPVKEGARALAVVEAMIGQFYVAVLLGALIGKRVSQGLAEKQTDTGNRP